jgi:hypothetical protein
MLRYMPIHSDRAMVPKSATALALPTLITAAGPRAQKRFLEFFTATIRNPNTRMAYARAVGQFLRWCERRGVHELDSIEPMLVAAYVEQRQEIGVAREAQVLAQRPVHLRVRPVVDRHAARWLVVDGSEDALLGGHARASAGQTVARWRRGWGWQRTAQA